MHVFLAPLGDDDDSDVASVASDDVRDDEQAGSLARAKSLVSSSACIARLRCPLESNTLVDLSPIDIASIVRKQG